VPITRMSEERPRRAACSRVSNKLWMLSAILVSPLPDAYATTPTAEPLEDVQSARVSLVREASSRIAGQKQLIPFDPSP